MRPNDGPSGQRNQRLRIAHAIGLAGLLLLSAIGCLSAGRGQASPDFVCSLDPNLHGTWQSSRQSQIGRASMKIKIDCDCSYQTTVRAFALMSIKEKGPIHTVAADTEPGNQGGNGSLVFGRGNGTETSWNYRAMGNTLELEEAPGEWHSYERTKTVRCDHESHEGN